jgi:aconitase A
MINALGVLGWGVGGIEAEAVMRCTLALEIMRTNGTRSAVQVTCPLDTHEEIA